eukprot:6237145-Amphidinium_carterae.1
MDVESTSTKLAPCHIPCCSSYIDDAKACDLLLLLAMGGTLNCCNQRDKDVPPEVSRKTPCGASDKCDVVDMAPPVCRWPPPTVESTSTAQDDVIRVTTDEVEMVAAHRSLSN